MELLELNANIRQNKGKGVSKALRRQGLVPGIFYGPKTAPLSLSIESLEIDKIFKHSGSNQAPLNLKIKNGDTVKKTAMIKDLQLHPVSKKYLHVDFYEIAMDKKIQVKVPVELTGTAKGAEAGGTLQLITREIDVLCLPMDIPEYVTVDVSEMEIGDSIHVEQLPVPDHVEIIADTNYTVVTVSSAMAEEVVEEEAEGIEEGEVSGEEEEGTEEE